MGVRGVDPPSVSVATQIRRVGAERVGCSCFGLDLVSSGLVESEH